LKQKEGRKIMRRQFGYLSLLYLGLCLLLTALPAQAATLSGDALVSALKQGGYIILMRHTSSPAAIPDKATANPDNTKPERQLDKNGETTATAFGAAVKKLGIPVGNVLSSPTYRALQTVKFAGLGTPMTAEQLGDGGTSMSPDAVAAWASWLKMTVATAPAAGKDTFIITHQPNIAAAFPTDGNGLADGQALVYHPDGKGGAEFVGTIKIEDWPQLAH
jgi:phosphohistidine phosphatase SixA